ncbi:hypothetical protein [Paractinoplanes durhamensis]|uniref:Fibronectin type-III domain-containing protein n=1 Tax=Paractinoplanes durhamensis TaxID=113563 RepID=A0ABQ3Z1J3_9ACTN|nr:hypothetical protein [Actinoplanes durhamensis]GIE03681.1 hypothetical protein Adu01nite_50310 [Actinoplanes durhamensis]
MRRTGKFALGLAATSLALGGCSGNATPSAAGTGSASPTPTNGPWVRVESGSPTATPSTGSTFSPRSALPAVSFLPTTGACGIAWPDNIGLVLIPMVITPISGGFKVDWPSKYGSYYRITAVPQGLVTGAQPEPTWQTVQAGANCTVSATITGLTSGAPYIIWLDAPDTPKGVEGTRSLYSGKSNVVKPL